MTARRVRAAVLCSFNLDLLRRPLLEAASQMGIDGELYFTGYGLWETESLDRESALHAFAPDVVIVFADEEDLLPPLAGGDLLPRKADAGARATAAWQRVENVIRGLLARLPGHASVLVHNLADTSRHPLGLLEDNAGFSQAAAREAFNASLRLLAEVEPRVRVIDYRGFVAEQGCRTLIDDRLWYLGRMRLGREGLERLAALYARYLAALFTPRCKCLVLDLDNTLWGGVLGEDGPEGIALGQEGVGLAFRDFQQAALALAQRGVLLAIASKNNPQDAMEVLENHPEMVLRPRNFACMEIHWNPKSESIQRIAQRLNLGLDSFVFWDDEPRERETIRNQLPEVLVPEIPADPAHHARALLSLDCFDVLNLTEEDRRRGEMYRQEADRQQWLAAAPSGDLGEFYRSLNMVVTIASADGYAVPRFAQLTQRTNQFNFTTRRYTEGDVRSMLADPAIGLYTASLEDRFGNLGVVGAAIVRRCPEAWELDTFLMSCRALGRGVEDALLAFLAAEASRAGRILRGEFIPTKKNLPARQFLERLGICLEADPSGSRFPIDPAKAVAPSWIELRVSLSEERPG